MPPAEMQAVVVGQFLAHDKPGAPPLTLVLERQIRRDIAMQVFDDAADRGPGREGIHDPVLGGPLIRNILNALLLRNRGLGTTVGSTPRNAEQSCALPNPGSGTPYAPAGRSGG